MVKDLSYLLKENWKLINEKDELQRKLNEAKEVIEAIKNGEIDAVFLANSATARVLVPESADQTYREFIENMTEGVVTVHPNGLILYSNSGFAKMVDLPLEKVIGTSFRKFIPADYMGYFEQFFKDHPEKSSKLELSIVNRKGMRIHLVMSVNKLNIRDIVALNFVLTDVTEQKKTEEKLIYVNETLENAIRERQTSESKVVALNSKLKENITILEDANTSLATFAYVASHDLQEPLRKIRTYSSLLIRDYYDVIDQQGQVYISYMQGASERMRNLIHDILEYSQLAKNELLFVPTSLQTVLEDTLNNLDITITETNAKISSGQALPVVEANASQMLQLFQNLISNSLKFKRLNVVPEIDITHEIVRGTEIGKTDEGSQYEEYCVISIKDNGIGFDPLYNDKIFLVFQRLIKSQQYQGTGIGLAICKKIVEQHNGTITARGNINEGSVFTITLPIRQPARKAVSGAPEVGDDLM